MIRNFSSFNFDPSVVQAVAIAKAGLEAVRPELLLEQAVQYNAGLKRLRFGGQSYDLDDYDRIFILGIGSDSLAAAKYLQAVLRGLPLRTVVMDPEATVSEQDGIYSVTHHPTASNAEATTQLLNYGPFSEEDLVIAVTDHSANSIVNAGSSMPPDQQRVVLQSLSELGASYNEQLTVAIHLAEGRGGDLGRLLEPARILNYVISNRLDESGQPVASSPFIQHSSTLYEAKDIVDRYNIMIYCDLESCIFVINEITTPQLGVVSVLLASPLTWLEPMKSMAKEFGLSPQIFTAQDLTFRDDMLWRQAHSGSHCLLSLFPQLNPLDEIEPYPDFSGTEIYLTSGVYNEAAGQLLVSGASSAAQPVIAEVPTFNVGAMGLRLT